MRRGGGVIQGVWLCEGLERRGGSERTESIVRRMVGDWCEVEERVWMIHGCQSGAEKMFG
jgi:hypothetical protein